MDKPPLSVSIPTKFDMRTLEKLRVAASKNQRSLSGEVRFRVIQTLQPEETVKKCGPS
jgi:hypothetical protein